MFLFMLLSIPVALAIFGAGYFGAIVWHAETWHYGREVQMQSGEIPVNDAETVTDRLVGVGLRMSR